MYCEGLCIWDDIYIYIDAESSGHVQDSVGTVTITILFIMSRGKTTLRRFRKRALRREHHSWASKMLSLLLPSWSAPQWVAGWWVNLACAPSSSWWLSVQPPVQLDIPSCPNWGVPGRLRIEKLHPFRNCWKHQSNRQGPWYRMIRILWFCVQLLNLYDCLGCCAHFPGDMTLPPSIPSRHMGLSDNTPFPFHPLISHHCPR